MSARGRMPAVEYRRLVGRIMRKYRRPLNLLRVEACEIADLVYWDEMTEARLFEHLDDMVADES